MILRDYQRQAIDSLYDWFRKNDTGNPCLVLPTGAGKSVILAELCRDALSSWPGTRILILSHVKELLEQDAEKIRILWPDAPLGIYSAGLGCRDVDAITVAGIQSVYRKASEIGYVDIAIVDECHLLNHKDEGMYRNLLNELEAINPSLRVIGLTATPYRLGHGLITEGGALFNALIEPVRIGELVERGYLAPLRSKGMELLLSVDGVKRRGGDFVESELAEMVNTKANNEAMVEQTLRIAQGRRSILVFCSGVQHAYAMRDLFREKGEVAEAVLGETDSEERARILEDFKAGRVRVVTNNSVLTTGFNAPNTDVLVMARPTESVVLYIQSAGRGMRPKEHVSDCLLLDFAGNVRRHGPITDVIPPKRKGDKKGEAPVKLCEQCQELVHLSAKVCPACGWAFPPPPPKRYVLGNEDIMGGPSSFGVEEWRWRRHTAASGKELVRVTYYGHSDSVDEYLCLLHGGYAAQKALSALRRMERNCGVTVGNPYDLDEVVETMQCAVPPKEITIQREGKYHRVVGKVWG